MLDIGWTEILVIAVVAIVVVPSKDLPKLLRSTGQMIGRVRRMAGDFQSQFNSALREAEREVDLSETRKQIGDIKSLNPLGDVKKALNPLKAAGEDIRKSLTDKGASPGATTRAAGQFVPPGEGAPSLPAPGAAASAPAPLDVPPPAVAPVAAPKIEPPATAVAAPVKPKAPKRPAQPKTNADGGAKAPAKPVAAKAPKAAAARPARAPRAAKSAPPSEGGST